MTIRKRRTPTPHFKLPSPFDPTTGERAPLVVQGVSPFCAMMQVAAEDTHDDYVVCRGFDTRVRKFFDYDEEDLENKPGIPVAKPYGKRHQGAYQIGQIFPAVLPLGRLGQNPSVAAVSSGHPADLDEEVEILYTDEEEESERKVINWLLLDSGGSGVRHFELKSPHTPGSTTPAHPQDWSGSAWVTDTDADREFDVTDPLSEYRGRGKDTFSSPHDTGSEGVAEKNGESGEWEIVRMQKHAVWLVGEVYADFATTDATFEISPNPQVAIDIGAIITDTDPAANITVHNIHGWDGTGAAKGVGDTVEVRWNETQTRWECTELDC